MGAHAVRVKCVAGELGGADGMQQFLQSRGEDTFVIMDQCQPQMGQWCR